MSQRADSKTRDGLMKRRREITVETERIVIRGELSEISWCEACAASAPMVAPAQAALLTGDEVEVLYRRIEQGQVHSTRRPGGTLMICLKSLSASGRKHMAIKVGPD
jgi:hypothetical protein